MNEQSTRDRGPLLRAERLSFGFQSEVVLKEVDLEIPRRGTLALLGPAGAGKSTLLRTLGRWNELHPAFWRHGTIWIDERDFLGLPIEEAQREVALLAQKARLYTSSILDNAIAETRGDRVLSRAEKYELARAALEPLGLWQELHRELERPVTELSIARQRMLAVARLLSGGALLLADEPLRDVAESEQRQMRAFLRRVAERVAIVLVEHDQKAARELSDEVCLITGRRIVERGPAATFFSAPRSELGQQYVRSGNCWPATPSDPPPPGEPPPTWKPTEQEQRVRPGGFHWILSGKLGGMQQPGLLCELSDDLHGLAALGVRHLVTLTEQAFVHPLLSELGIRCMHFPIVDMSVPSLHSALVLCERVSELVDAGQPVVLHCKAGLGRTGTMLACTLVHRGETAVGAIHRVRAVNTRYIQSEVQLQLIAELERAVRAMRVTHP